MWKISLQIKKAWKKEIWIQIDDGTPCHRTKRWIMKGLRPIFRVRFPLRQRRTSKFKAENFFFLANKRTFVSTPVCWKDGTTNHCVLRALKTSRSCSRRQTYVFQSKIAQGIQKWVQNNQLSSLPSNVFFKKLFSAPKIIKRNWTFCWCLNFNDNIYG